MPAAKFVTIEEAREQVAEALSADLERMIRELATALGQGFDRPTTEVRAFIEEFLLTNETMNRRLVDGLAGIEVEFFAALEARSVDKWC